MYTCRAYSYLKFVYCTIYIITFYTPHLIHRLTWDMYNTRDIKIADIPLINTSSENDSIDHVEV